MEIVNSIFFTAIIFAMLSILAIKIHGDDEPAYWVKVVECLCLLLSGGVAIVTALIIIWN
jgi:hypothetical protein